VDEGLSVSNNETINRVMVGFLRGNVIMFARIDGLTLDSRARALSFNFDLFYKNRYKRVDRSVLWELTGSMVNWYWRYKIGLDRSTDIWASYFMFSFARTVSGKKREKERELSWLQTNRELRSRLWHKEFHPETLSVSLNLCMRA